MSQQNKPAGVDPGEVGAPAAATAAGPADLSAPGSFTDEQALRQAISADALDETEMCLLLERKDLPATLLEEISKRKSWRSNYRVRRALAGHPHTPRTIAMRLVRELHLMDLVRISVAPASPAELRRLAEERILAQLPLLPVGQRLSLARRGPSRVAAGLVAQGPGQVSGVALDNPYLSEAHLLKTLAMPSLAERTITRIAEHEKWSKLLNVRVALLRHPRSPESAFVNLADLPRRSIEELLGVSTLAGHIRRLLLDELGRRR